MKHSVIYTKPVTEIDPKTKRRTVIPAGTAARLSDAELAGIRHAVRVVKTVRADEKRPTAEIVEASE